MSKKKIYLNENQIRAIFRFEDKRDYQEFEDASIKVEIVEPIKLRFEDLKIAVSNFNASKLDTEAIYNSWYRILNDALCLVDDSLFLIDESDDIDVRGIDSDFDAYMDILDSIEALLLGGDDTLTWDEIIRDINRAIANRGKDALDRIYTTYDEDSFIETIDAGHHLDEATEKELFLYRCFVEKGLKRKSKSAMYAAAYGHYGGNKVFDCDWKQSEELLLALIEDGDENPFIANTLGYIYYYGRTTNKVPQYDKAFKYFSIGAAGGVYESKYKLADMFKHGFGVTKNTRIERQIIDELYAENIRYIADGNFDCKFADIALRKGAMLCDVNAPDPDLFDMYSAYYYFLQADFAIRRRRECTSYYGDGKVFDGIEKSLQKCREAFNFADSKTTVIGNLEMLLHDSLSFGHMIEAKLKPLASGSYSVTFKVLKKGNEKYAPKLFVTLPDIDFCGMLSSIKVKITPYSEFIIPDDRDTILFDSVDYDELLCYGNTAANLFGEIRLSISSGKNEKTYHIASVSYGGSGKLYDYICEDLNVAEGDYALVDKRGAREKVLVVKINDKKESELALPISAYKKLKGKA